MRPVKSVWFGCALVVVGLLSGCPGPTSELPDGGDELVVCGGLGEACCATGAACSGTLTCQASTCQEPPPPPPPCGDTGQACCTTAPACLGFLTCQAGMCRTPPPPCGQAGQACCTTAPACAAPLVCLSQVCAAAEGSIQVVNHLALSIQHIYLTPSLDLGWGGDRLSAPLASGATVTFTGVAAGTWHVKTTLVTGSTRTYEREVVAGQVAQIDVSP